MSDLGRKKSVLLVDAMGLYLRHYIAHPALGRDGQHVGGIIGFLQDLKKIIEKFRPDPVYVVWEGGGSPRRRAIYADYKKRRRPQRLNRFYSDDMSSGSGSNDQIKILIKLLKYTPICQIYVEDCEADDVIGYMARYHSKDALNVILSADKDYYQLISDGAIIYSPTWKRLVQEVDVIERFGIHPANFSLAKSICGDDSDNIPGVEGVGFKTLAKRFACLSESKETTITELLEQANQLLKDGTKIKAIQNIADNELLIRRNWSLINLDTSNLAAYQITKINSICNNFSPTRNKIEFIRTLLSEGIQTFNVDQFFLSLIHIQSK